MREIEFRETAPMARVKGPALAVALLVGSAVKTATLKQRAELHQVPDMLNRRAPFATIAEFIFDTMGPDWAPDIETLAAIEAANPQEGKK